MKNISYLFLFLVVIIAACCSPDDGPDSVDESVLTDTPYDPQPYVIVTSSNMPTMEIPSDNPLTVDGVQLGRHLFYDPILSLDSTMSCSTCHLPAGSFTDNLDVSTGIDGIAGARSSMSLLNVGYFNNGLFWDGRSQTLEEQALLPVEDPIELHNTWTNVIEKLKVHADYPVMFRKAFGISSKDEMTKELAAKALASFERIMVSSGQSKFDLVESQVGNNQYSDEENLGRDLFFVESQSVNHPGCSHCHNGALLTNNLYENNGLDMVNSLEDFEDKGHGAVTGNLLDNGRFRIPTLKNIELTAPYMHDGRFQTLEEVIDHYQSGGHPADNISPLQLPFTLTDTEKANLIAFMKTFTDMEFVNNPDLQSPF